MANKWLCFASVYWFSWSRDRDAPLAIKKKKGWLVFFFFFPISFSLLFCWIRMKISFCCLPVGFQTQQGWQTCLSYPICYMLLPLPSLLPWHLAAFTSGLSAGSIPCCPSPRRWGVVPLQWVPFARRSRGTARRAEQRWGGVWVHVLLFLGAPHQTRSERSCTTRTWLRVAGLTARSYLRFSSNISKITVSTEGCS